ncbi:NAD(P)-dependent oxidoreductase [Actinoallomurus sp. NPDC052274]|uniref:NAD(P)-dependent oxidoreductase n=1 Tax=Actinoallomurus sp. NPDC052274 TaxID=3155420 RepID=UPI003417DF9D
MGGADGTRVGFVGVGRMGTPMCRNLARADGYRVLASDIDPARADVVEACGAAWTPVTAEAARSADVLITMLPGAEAVAAAMVGGGLVDALPSGAVWIDMSSNSPAAADPIRRLAAARGIDVLDAPVGGGVPAAEAGTLQFFVGGDGAVLKRHRPLLEVLGDPARITHVGGHGSGYTVKLIVNLLWFGQAVATAESLLLGLRMGVDLATLRRALADSAAESRFIRRDLDALFAGDYMTTFGVDRCYEELAAVTDLARAHQVPFELSEAVRRIYERAAARYGTADGELLAVRLLEEESGRWLRTE